MSYDDIEIVHDANEEYSIEIDLQGRYSLDEIYCWQRYTLLRDVRLMRTWQDYRRIAAAWLRWRGYQVKRVLQEVVRA